MFRGENIMLSTSTSNSSFLNANSTADYNETDDRIQILDCDSTRTYQEPLSQTRKICFIASIVGTVLVVIVFLLLPCESNCVANTGFLKTRNWIKSFEKMEFKGDVNTVVHSPSDGPHQSLVFMYRADKIFPDMNAAKKSKAKSNGGVMTLSGNSGKLSWSREMTNEPRSIDCNLIDCDKSGTNDCLILDDFGQLACLDGSGHFIYYISNSKATKQTRKDLLDFPLILPDLNGDKVNEVMMGSPTGKSNTTDIIILSGANGKLLLKETQNCSFVHKLQIDADFVIKFICMVKEDTEQQVFKNLTDLYSRVSKKPLDLKKLEPVAKINQHKFYGKRATTVEQTTISNVQDKKLEIVNKGSWPRDSKVFINLTSPVNGVQKVHFEYSATRVYAMVPVPFSLNGSAGSRKVDNIHGFVIKFWIWNGTEVNYNLEKNRIKRSNEKRDLKAQRSNYTNQTFAGGSVYKTKVFFLKESIMLIVFNNSNMKVENASQSNIVQFCQRTVGQKDKSGEKRTENDSICQPELSYQENSVLITDIDGDGSKELVSYYSTFINENHSDDVVGDRWKLKTFIQLFKLETELPKLYADLDHY